MSTSSHPPSSHAESNADDWQQALPITALQAQLDEGSEVATLAQPGDWGYYLSVGRELGYFSWFASRVSMLRYLVQIEILHAPTSLPDREHYDELVAEIQAVAASYERDGDGPAACQSFNRCFPDFKLEWLGSFAELCSSDQAFARLVRINWGKPFDPSKPKDLADFAVFLEQYGL